MAPRASSKKKMNSKMKNYSKKMKKQGNNKMLSKKALALILGGAASGVAADILDEIVKDAILPTRAHVEAHAEKLETMGMDVNQYLSAAKKVIDTFAKNEVEKALSEGRVDGGEGKELRMPPKQKYTHKHPNETLDAEETAAEDWTKRLDGLLPKVELQKVNVEGKTRFHLATSWRDPLLYKDVPESETFKGWSFSEKDAKFRFAAFENEETAVRVDEAAKNPELRPQLDSAYWYPSVPAGPPLSGPHNEEIYIPSAQLEQESAPVTPCLLVEYEMRSVEEYNEDLAKDEMQVDDGAEAQVVQDLFSPTEATAKFRLGKSLTSDDSKDVWNFVKRLVEGRANPGTALSIAPQPKMRSLNASLPLNGADRNQRQMGVLAHPNPFELAKVIPEAFPSISMVHRVKRIFPVLGDDGKPVCDFAGDAALKHEVETSPGFGSMFNQYDANTGRGKVDAQVLAAHATGVENIKNILEFGFKRPTKTNTYNKLQGDNSYVEGQQYAIDQWMFQPDQFKALGDGLFLTTSWLKMDQYTTPFDYTNAELKKVLQEAQEKIRNHSVETGDKTEAMKDTTAGPDGCPVQRLKQFYQKIRYFLDTASADFLATTVGANFRLDLLANESETGGNDTFRKVKYATSTKVIRDPRFGFVTKASVPQFRTLLAGVGDVHAATPLGKTAPPVKVPMKTWVKAYNNWVHKTVKKLTDIQEKVDAAVLKGTEPMMRRDGVIAATSTATGVVNLQERTFLGKQHGGNSVEHLHQVCEISHPTEAELPMIPEKIYTHKNPFSDEETRKNVETAARKWTERLDTLENLKLEKDAHGVTYISTTWSDKNQYQTVLKDNPELKHRLMRLPEGSTTVEDEETLDPRLTADYWYASNPLRKGEHDAKVSPFAPFGPHQEELNIGSPEKAKPCWMVEYKMVTKREYNDLLLGKGKEGAASGEEIANLFNGGDEDEMKYKIEELTRDNWGSSGVSSGSASIAAQYIGRMVENRDTPFTPMELPQYDEQVKNMSEGAGDRLVINTNMYLAGADRDVKSIGVLAKPNPQELDPLKGTPRDFETVTLVPFVVRIFRVVDAKDSRPVCLADADKNVLDDLTASPGFGSLFKAQKEFSEGQRKSIQVFAAHGTGVENIHGILREGFKKGGKARPMLGHGEKKRLQQWEFQPDQFLTLGAGLYLTTSWSKVDQYAAPFDTQNKDLTSLLLEANKAGAGSYEWTALKKYQQKVRYMLNTIAGNSKALDTLAHAGYVAPSAEGTEFTRGVQYKASTKAVRDSRFAFVAEAELSNPVFTLLAGVGDLHGKRVPMVVWMKAYNQWFDNKVKELTSRIDGEQAGKGAKLEDIIEAGLAGINLEEKDSHPDCASASGSAV